MSWMVSPSGGIEDFIALAGGAENALVQMGLISSYKVRRVRRSDVATLFY